eukprot:SAG22_NODE_2257_length_2780_cov_2.690041_3_plen_182_part_00
MTLTATAPSRFESYHAPSFKEKFVREQLSKHATTRPAPTAHQSDYEWESVRRPPELPSRFAAAMRVVPLHKLELGLRVPVQTPILDDIKQVLKSYRRKHGIKASDSAPAVLWYAFWGGLHYLLLAAWLHGSSTMASNLVFGLTIWFWSGDMLHSGTHYGEAGSGPFNRSVSLLSISPRSRG